MLQFSNWSNDVLNWFDWIELCSLGQVNYRYRSGWFYNNWRAGSGREEVGSKKVEGGRGGGVEGLLSLETRWRSHDDGGLKTLERDRGERNAGIRIRLFIRREEVMGLVGVKIYARLYIMHHVHHASCMYQRTGLRAWYESLDVRSLDLGWKLEHAGINDKRVWGSRDVGESRCGGVAVWGGCSVWGLQYMGSQWLPNLRSLRFRRFPRFPRISRKTNYLKNSLRLNRLPQLILQ